MSDLCWVCQQNSVAIIRAANTAEEEKSQVTITKWFCDQCSNFHVDSQVLRDAEEHLQLATQERSFYRDAIDKSQVALKDAFSIDGVLQVPPVSCCLPRASNDIEMHFSFDMAQQVKWLYMYVNHYELACTRDSIGALSKWSAAAWTCLFPHATQVCHFRDLLWGNSTTGEYNAVYFTHVILI